MGELVLIPRDLAERVTEIANRNEQSAEGDRLAALLSSPTTSLPEDAARVEQTDEQFHKTLKDAYEKSDMDAAARALSGRLRQMEKRAKAANARADRLAAEIELAKPVYSRRELERKVAVAKEALEATREAIALHRSYERTPTDRGGSLGPKGKARSAWIEAEAFAEGRVDTALASLEDRT